MGPMCISLFGASIGYSKYPPEVIALGPHSPLQGAITYIGAEDKFSPCAMSGKEYV